MLSIAVALHWVERTRRPLGAGARFRVYVASYLAFRFAIEFIKPRACLLPGLSAIQLASLLGCGFCLCDWLRRSARPASAV